MNLFRIKREQQRTIGDTLGQGVDIVGTVLVFFGIGWLLDRWLGTMPLFMVLLTVVAAVGKVVLMLVRYNQVMEEHEQRFRAGRP